LSTNNIEERAKESWRHKHAMARVFYSAIHNKMMKIWKRISTGKELRPSLWTEFVENDELWEMVWTKVSTLSSYSHELFEGAELIEEGNEALTKEREAYFLVPLNHVSAEIHGGVLETVMGEARMRYICQQFLKTILLYAFADIYGKSFTVSFMTHPEMEVDLNTICQPLFMERSS
jgi:hypothetical protein